MERVLILNGSPRATKSNSRRYSEIFSTALQKRSDYEMITKSNHLELCSRMENYSDVVFVFPLYADAIPVTLLNFLKVLELHLPEKKPTISVLINCGFLEIRQNDVAVQMMKLFCRQNQFKWGSVLKIATGEAILDSPFRFMAERAIRKFALSVQQAEYGEFATSMPLPRFLFLKASRQYWIRYGKKYGISEKEMETMRIE